MPAAIELLEDRALLSTIGAEWLDQFGTSAGDFPESIAVGVDGSIFVSGFTAGAMEGQINAGGGDAYLRKYNSDGTIEWTRQFGTSSSERAQSISVGADGSVYIGGSTSGALDGQSSAGRADPYLRKYYADGTVAWTRQFGTSSGDSIDGVSVGPDSSIYVVGTTGGALEGQNSAGFSDAFIRKYQSDGTVRWTRQFGTSSSDSARSVSVESDGSVVVMGFAGSALAGQTSTSDASVFVRTYDPDGAVVWTRQFGINSHERITVTGFFAGGDGSVYIAGWTDATLEGQTSAGNYDAFVRKYDPDDSVGWTRQFGSSFNDRALSVAVGSDGSVFVTGTGAGTLEEAVAGYADAFIRKYRSDGSLVLTHQFGTSSHEEGRSVAVGPDGGVYLAGHTYGALNGQISAGDADAFVARFVFTRVVEPYSLSGMVYVDVNKDGEVNFGESGIADVAVTLVGTDGQGNTVEQSALTDADGYYGFFDLRPGQYSIIQTQPEGYLQGLNSVGTLGGTLEALDEIFVTLPDEVLGPVSNTDGLNYNFGEWREAGAALSSGYTASIGFWNNKHGQNLIYSLSEGTTQLGDWLAATFENMFGGLAGHSNAQVASHFQQLFAVKGMKLEAQVMATALAVYATNSTLAGTTAEAYGLTVTEQGVGNLTVNVGSSGAAFGVDDETTLSILDLLIATDEQAENGVLYFGGDEQLSNWLRSLANEVYGDINKAS